MTRPPWLPALVQRHRREDDPQPHPLGYEVALHEVRTAADKTEYVIDPMDWCRQVLDHDKEQWSWRTDPGLDRSGYLPVFSFSNQDTALLFKLRWY